MKKKRVKILFFYFLLVFILGIIIELVPNISGALVKTEVIPYDKMQISDKVKCFIVRNERVHLSDSNGDINYYVEDGTKVRKGAKILDLVNIKIEETKDNSDDNWERLKKSESVVYGQNSAMNGILSYYVDGYEGIFDYNNLKKLKYQDFKNENVKPSNLTRKSANKGEPIFKVCDDRKWYIIYWIPAGNISKYLVGENVTVNLGNNNIKAKIENLLDNDDMWMVVLSTTYYYEDFHKKRTFQAEVITSEYSGIKVKNSSIATKKIKGDIQTGVYVKQKNGDFLFKPVKIINSDGEYSLLKDTYYYDERGEQVNTVDVYDEILKNPSESR